MTVDEADYLPNRVRMISLGDSGSGKSALIKRHCEHRFVSRYVMTIGIDYGVIKSKFKDKNVSISIFDVGGQQLFREVRQEFYPETEAVLLVFDAREEKPLIGLQRWIDEFTEEGGSTERALVIIAANKIDLASAVDLTDVRIWAEQKGFKFMKTSAATAEGVAEIFELVASASMEETRGPVEQNFTNAQIEAVKKIRSARDNYERLGLLPGSTRDQINKQYKKMAILLHPDKSLAPGAEEAFKLLTIARSQLLRYAN